MKDKEWLINEIMNDNTLTNSARYRVLSKIKQMDEFIDDLVKLETVDKPEVPRYVADWLESENYHIERLFNNMKSGNYPDEVRKWITENRELKGENHYGYVAKLFTNGYTIKKEPKTYRFEQEAFMEQDFKAYSLKEAREKSTERMG